MAGHQQPWRWLAGALMAAVLAHAQASPERVVSVSPSGATVPENLLRLSIKFDVPPEGQVLRRLALFGQGDKQIAEPFLEQELWSPDGKTLTVLLHPGRVKTGLIAREERGSILTEGEEVRLTLDGHTIQHWAVNGRDERGPKPSLWILSALQAGRRESLVVYLDAPIDAMDVDYLAIVDSSGRRVKGRAALTDGETTWTFVPSDRWRAGPYKLLVQGTLEDPSGNRLNSQFETRIGKASLSPHDDEILIAVPCSRSARCH